MAALVLLPHSASAQQAATPEEQLAQRYSPIVYLKQQVEPCSTDGEQYLPAPVEIVFDDPSVALKLRTEEKSTDPVIATAPSQKDALKAGANGYLDFPGNPRDAGCDFETHARERMGDLPTTTYARVYVDQARRRVALQYWFYYYFNDFNNTHESDWEMIQLVFDATSVEEALNEEPTVIGFAQHGGGELARWSDTKLLREGNHPVIYAARGSHASYFGSNVYVGWGEGGTGFGCDDTRGPSVRYELRPVLLPADPDPNGPLAWILYEGSWGERQPWEFDGPTGPNVGTKWKDPLKAISDWRPSSLMVPASNTLGPTATDFFCRVSAAFSQILISAGLHPWAALAAFLALLVLPVYLIVTNRHLLGEAVRVYREHWRLFLALGLLSIPIGLAFNVVQLLLSEVPVVDWFLKWFENSNVAVLGLTLLVGGLQQAAMVLLVMPPVIQAMVELRDGRRPSAVECYREALSRIAPIGLALLILVVVSGALALIIVGIPLAIWLSVRWQFYSQAIIVDRAPSARQALRASAQAVQGHWLRTLIVTVAFQMIGALPGPLIGLVLLIFGGSSVQLANSVSSLIYAVTIPITAIALTQFYLRLPGRTEPSVTTPLVVSPKLDPGTAAT